MNRYIAMEMLNQQRILLFTVAVDGEKSEREVNANACILAHPIVLALNSSHPLLRKNRNLVPHDHHRLDSDLLYIRNRYIGVA